MSGILPILPKERIWGVWDYTGVNIGLAIATWCFLTGGAVANLTNLKMGIAALLAGNLIGVLLVSLPTALPSAKFGVDQYVFTRCLFGHKGKILPLLLNVVFGFGWSSVLCIMFGQAASKVLASFTGIGESTALVVTLSLVALFFSWLIVWRGPVSINWLNRIVSPGLVIVLIGMGLLILKKHSFSELVALQPIAPTPDLWTNYMFVFEIGLGAGFSWWPVIGGLTRLTKTQRAAYWPNLVGFGILAVVANAIGLTSGLAYKSIDPTEWMIPLGGPVFGIVALAFIGFANLTSTASIAYVSCLALKSMKAVNRITWGKLTFLFLLPAVPLIFFPNQLYSNAPIFLVLCGTTLGPLTGIGLVDYFLLRKQKIDLRSLYTEDANRPYSFWGGYNYSAIIAAVIGVISYTLLLDPITFESSPLFFNVTATLPATFIGGFTHYLLTKTIVIPKGLGGYTTQAQMENVHSFH